MSKVLFPTDFSTRSVRAFRYALEFAEKVNKSIVVYHTYENVEERGDDEVYDHNDIINFRKDSTFFPPFENIRMEGYEHVSVSYVVQKGEFLSLLENYVQTSYEEVDVIMLGSRSGRLALMADLFDQVSVQILKSLPKDLVVVPNHSNFIGKLDNLVYLIDYSEENIQALADFINDYLPADSMLHVVHFDLAHTDSITGNLDKVKERFVDSNKNLLFDSVDSNDIKKSLEDYCHHNKIDLVCIMNHHQGSGFFGNYNLAEHLIEQLPIPIMVTYKKSEK